MKNILFIIKLKIAFFFIGDTVSRKIFYHVRIINPFFFLILSVTGMVIGLSDITILVPICPLLVAFANGSMFVFYFSFIFIKFELLIEILQIHSNESIDRS